MEKRLYSESEIRARLMSGDKFFLIRGLLAIYEQQTSLERLAMMTFEHNKVGFDGFDAEILTSYAEQWRRKQMLSKKQWAVLKNKMPKYSKQLHNIGKAKLEASQSSTITMELSEAQNIDRVYIFPNGVQIDFLDMTPQYHNEEIVAWRCVVDNIEYLLIND